MPDMTEQLGALLSDPQGMEKIKAMAESLFGGSSASLPQPAPTSAEPEVSMPDIGSIAKIAEMIKPRQDDSRVRLLLALKPHLQPERQTRVDKAVKMLRLLDMAPMLSKLGLFEL